MDQAPPEIEARMFAPRPSIPRHHTRRYALLRELKLLERQPVKHLAGINDTIERRLMRNSPKPREKAKANN